MATKDYYKILGVDKKSTEEEIKKAYHRLAHQYHPDKAGGDEKKFKEINEAYQVLSNKEKREQYDRFGTAFESPFGGFSYGQPFGSGSPFSRGFDFSDFFRQGRRGQEFNFDFGDIFEGFFGGGRTQTERRRKGSDISIDFEISLEEAFNGLTRPVELKKYVECSHCGGSGAEPGSVMKNCPQCGSSGEIKRVRQTILGSISEIAICPSCQGTGAKPEKVCRECRGEGRKIGYQNVKIQIPVGIQNSQVIKITGGGEMAERGGAAGDLYVSVHIRPHRHFRREGSDLYFELPVSFSQAALGDKVEVPTIDGMIELKIPAGAEAGKVLRIKSRGMKQMGRDARGDFFVKLHIQTPKSLTKEQRELMERLKEKGL